MRAQEARALLFIVVLMLAICPEIASGAIVFLGNTKASNSTTNSAVTSAQDTTGANLIVAVAIGYSTPSCTTTGGGVAMSDSKGNTWTAVQNYTAGNGNVCVIYSTPTSVGTGHTFTLATGLGGSYPTVFISWYSGAASSSPKDQHTGASSSTGTTLQTGNITPTENGELVITGVGDGASAHSRSVDLMDVTPWKDNQNSNSFSTGAWSYQIQTTATAVNPTWTLGGTVGRGVTIVSFKAAGAAPQLSPLRRTVLMGGE